MHSTELACTELVEVSKCRSVLTYFVKRMRQFENVNLILYELYELLKQKIQNRKQQQPNQIAHVPKRCTCFVIKHIDPFRISMNTSVHQ